MVGTDDLRQLLTATTKAGSKTVFVGDPHQLAPGKARGGMFEQFCDELPWAQWLSEVWRMHNAEERDASLALRSGHGNRLRRAVGWYRTHDRLHTGDPIAMASDALHAYLADRDAGKDSLLMCDTWEIADALNWRLHDTLTADGPIVRGARDQEIRVGDLIMSRNNDAGVDVRLGSEYRLGDRADQVRNGNRWRVAAVDAATNRVAAERTTDQARAVFDDDYLREHVTLGYAATVHSAQGVTADTSSAILGEGSSRAMLYVALTRGRDNNAAFLYQRITGEADHEHARPITYAGIHQLQRGNKYCAAQYFRMILANDDRPRTMHAEAERTERHLLPDVVSDLLQYHEQRGAARRAVWCEHTATARAQRAAAYERMAGAADRGAERTLDLDADGLEL